jgi:hypothetical protein
MLTDRPAGPPKSRPLLAPRACRVTIGGLEPHPGSLMTTREIATALQRVEISSAVRDATPVELEIEVGGH